MTQSVFSSTPLETVKPPSMVSCGVTSLSSSFASYLPKPPHRVIPPMVNLAVSLHFESYQVPIPRPRFLTRRIQTEMTLVRDVRRHTVVRPRMPSSRKHTVVRPRMPLSRLTLPLDALDPPWITRSPNRPRYIRLSHFSFHHRLLVPFSCHCPVRVSKCPAVLGGLGYCKVHASIYQTRFT